MQEASRRIVVGGNELGNTTDRLNSTSSVCAGGHDHTYGFGSREVDCPKPVVRRKRKKLSKEERSRGNLEHGYAVVDRSILPPSETPTEAVPVSPVRPAVPTVHRTDDHLYASLKALERTSRTNRAQTDHLYASSHRESVSAMEVGAEACVQNLAEMETEESVIEEITVPGVFGNAASASASVEEGQESSQVSSLRETKSDATISAVPRRKRKRDEGTDWDGLSHDDLLARAKAMDVQLKQLQNVLAKITNQDENGASTAKTRGKGRPFDFERYGKRHVALWICYLGWDYHGFAAQEGEGWDTIEKQLFLVMLKTKLIRDRAESNYHRCGRTDKGVSAFTQVISIDLRSKNPPGEESDGDELDYCNILNRVLPQDIRAIAWAVVPQDFSARFSCLSREYKYFFPKGDLDVSKMKEAAQQLLGTYDFRNLCKPDIGNGVRNFMRSVSRVEIEDSAHLPGMCVFTLAGKAFLWHQVRCIMAILVLVGQGRENPEIISWLLDVEKNPCKPQYTMAWEVPLCLFSCAFEGVTWRTDESSYKFVIRDLQRQWTQVSVKSAMIAEMLGSLSRSFPQFETPLISADFLVSGVKAKTYVPLEQRPKCGAIMVRFKNRYVVCALITPEGTKREKKTYTSLMKNLNSDKISEVIMTTVKKIHGDFGVASLRPGFKICHYFSKTGHFIIRARLGPHKLGLTAMPFVTEVDGSAVALQTLQLGATLKHSYMFLTGLLGEEMKEKKMALES